MFCMKLRFLIMLFGACAASASLQASVSVESVLDPASASADNTEQVEKLLDEVCKDVLKILPKNQTPVAFDATSLPNELSQPNPSSFLGRILSTSLQTS